MECSFASRDASQCHDALRELLANKGQSMLTGKDIHRHQYTYAVAKAGAAAIVTFGMQNTREGVLNPFCDYCGEEETYDVASWSSCSCGNAAAAATGVPWTSVA